MMNAPQQAGMTCREPLFQIFVGADDADAAAVWVRDHCGVRSRRELQPGTRAARRWRRLHARFVCWRDYPELEERNDGQI